MSHPSGDHELGSLTARLTATAVLVSNDDGRTIRLTGSAADALRECVGRHIDETELSWDEVSAACLAGLAEAARLKPQATGRVPEALPAGGGARISLNPIVVRGPVPEALAQRQSTRRFRPLALDDLSAILTAVGHVQGVERLDDGFQKSFRPYPSAGGRHPIELLIATQAVENLTPGLWWFDQATCELVDASPNLGAKRPAALEAVCTALDTSETPPAVIFLVADFERTLSRYPAGASLVWRDAGVLAGLLHLAASSLSLASTIVGTAACLVTDTADAFPRADVGAVAVGRPFESGPKTVSEAGRADQ